MPAQALAIGVFGMSGFQRSRGRCDAAFALKEIWLSRRGELDWPAPVSLSEAEIMGLAKYAEGSSVITTKPDEDR